MPPNTFVAVQQWNDLRNKVKTQMHSQPLDTIFTDNLSHPALLLEINSKIQCSYVKMTA